MSANTTKDGVAVKAGQVWRDLDHRMKGRKITIVSVNDGNAYFRRLPHHINLSSIMISRMHKSSTGWELVTA